MAQQKQNGAQPQASTSKQSSERTSAAQLQCVATILSRGLRAIGRHLRRVSAIYGFLAGAITVLLILAAIIWYGVFAYPLPWKVIDPTDPRFDPQSFRFTDYDTGRELGEALRAMFPVGTSKEQIDALLSRSGVHIRPYTPAKREKTPPNLYYYSYSNWRSYILDRLLVMPADDNAWEAAVYFDENNKISKIVGINP